MIDVLLVILIFLMVTTTCSSSPAFEINLPHRGCPGPEQGAAQRINVVVTAAGDVMVNKGRRSAGGVNVIAAALKRAAASETTRSRWSSSMPTPKATHQT